MSTLHIKDEIARRKLELMRQDVRDGADYTRPWLDLDVEAYRAYRQGDTDVLPTPYCDKPVDRIMMENVRGMEVLCLAGGGGQQSAVYSLLGARVTVLDLTLEQLERDQQAAAHYGHEVTTVQGDMRDLSALPAASYDRVVQPISTLFVPDLREVYAQVARVLVPGGLYVSDYAVPLLYMAENRGWDGEGYALYVREPYVRGAILETGDGVLNYAQGESYSEFHHLLSDIVNGLVAESLIVRGLWENPRPGHGPPLEELEPGSPAHQDRYLPFGLTLIAEGTGSTLQEKPKYTRKQGQYLSFIYHYTKIHGQPPSEVDMQWHFRVTPPTVHQMILRLEERRFIAREPGQARSIRVLLPYKELPELE